MGPWRPPNWIGNHFVPVLKQASHTLKPKESQQIGSSTSAPSQQGQFQPKQFSTPINRFLNKESMTEKKPQAARVVEIPTVQNVPSDDKDTENDTPFKPTKELSTPASSFLIKDILGNEFKITQIQTQDTVGTSNVNYRIDREIVVQIMISIFNSISKMIQQNRT